MVLRFGESEFFDVTLTIFVHLICFKSCFFDDSVDIYEEFYFLLQVYRKVTKIFVSGNLFFTRFVM